MILRRYWFEFDVSLNSPYVLLLQGCGVTAYDNEDALQLIREQILKGAAMPPIKATIEDVDVSLLDSDHVLPNIGNVMRRGIWFPHTFE